MDAKWGRAVLWCLVGALAAGTGAGLGTSAWLYGRLADAERRLDVNGLKANDVIRPGQELKIPAEAPAKAPPAVRRPTGGVDDGLKPAGPALPLHLQVVRQKYDGQREIDLTFNEPPDVSVLRDHLAAGPLREGGLSIRPCPWDARQVFVAGDFAYRTNLTLRIRAGLPSSRTNGVEKLARDYVRTFQRKDHPPTVQFLDAGRYLPPGGARTLALDCVNVSRVRCAAAALPPANIVHLLARDEGAYDEYVYGSIGADTEATETLADRLVEWDVEVDGRLNEHAVAPLALRKLPDAVSNGVFLVVARSADRPRQERNYYLDEGEVHNPNRYRLVCVTDIGLTFRRDGRNLHVWATSLMKGEPIPDCILEVYGANNRLLASGRSDARGLCTLACADKAEPFAVIARAADGSDTSFACLSGKHSLDELNLPGGAREPYLKPDDVTAFVWTERDIYRHGEKMFLHAIVRNGRDAAPGPFPVELRLVDPEGGVYLKKTVVTDAQGAVWCDTFSVPADRPSGRWRLVAATPGPKGRVLGSREVSVEAFAPPRISVTVEGRGDHATNFAFTVGAEHLYGGPARGLPCGGAVVFTDVPFAPAAWKGWRFGNEQLGLKPNGRRLSRSRLDERGEARFDAPLLAETGRPKAAIRVAAEGTAFEEGGRPARARCTRILHYYPFYVGATLGANVRVPAAGFAKTRVACVKPDGARLAEPRRLKVLFERVDSVYSCREDGQGWTTWHCDRVRVPMKTPAAEIETRADGDVELEIPFRADGDYALTLTDAASGASFGATFWLGSRGDDAVRAPLANPAEVTLAPDKALYRPGDVPRLLVKAPFAGWALLTVLRDRVLYRKVLKLDGPTQELALEPVDGSWAPNVDVALSVVQSAANGGRHQTARAHGRVALAVRRPENEIPVSVAAHYAPAANGGGTLTVDVLARSASATGAVAVVTVVDEGIHLLTGWRTPDPVGRFARGRCADLPLYDLFDSLLPVWDGDPLKTRGAKTGGGFGEDMLGRVSPVPSRRFKPLARWQAALPLTAGAGRTTFALPEFVGEVRVTAVACSANAVGAGDVQAKVTPKLVAQPDAPRFAAPGDEFDATLMLANRGGAAGEVRWSLAATGSVACAGTVRTETLAPDASVVRTVRVKATEVPGQGVLTFTAEGFGERHVQTVELPVRPAVAARETSGTVMLAPGEARTFGLDAKGSMPGAAVRTFTPGGSALAELKGALEYLADYPHGCLEQTTSRIFPLIAAGGFLNRLGTSGATNRADVVKAGVRRVASMIRAHDFVMWPDCTYAPWDREVSLWACHFLVAAEASGVELAPRAREQVKAFLLKWSSGTNLAEAAYACHTLALSGRGDACLDRMNVLYGSRAELRPLDRARLARAFVRLGGREKAAQLLAGAGQPESVREAAFTVLALLEQDPQDARLPGLVRYLETRRGRERFHWGTTGENAHALLALAAYYSHHPVAEGRPEVVLTDASGAAKPLAEKRPETVRGAGDVTLANRGAGGAWVSWRTVELPAAGTVTNESHVLRIARRYLTVAGEPADLASLVRGDVLVVELALSSSEARTFNDLVVQDLFPAAFEPERGGLDRGLHPWVYRDGNGADWVMRSDARDDRMLVFSKRFAVKAGQSVHFRYPVRVVSVGSFTLPGPTVEAMYAPEIRACAAPAVLKVAP